MGKSYNSLDLRRKSNVHKTSYARSIYVIVTKGSHIVATKTVQTWCVASIQNWETLNYCRGLGLWDRAYESQLGTSPLPWLLRNSLSPTRYTKMYLQVMHLFQGCFSSAGSSCHSPLVAYHDDMQRHPIWSRSSIGGLHHRNELLFYVWCHSHVYWICFN